MEEERGEEEEEENRVRKNVKQKEHAKVKRKQSVVEKDVNKTFYIFNTFHKPTKFDALLLCILIF